MLTCLLNLQILVQKDFFLYLKPILAGVTIIRNHRNHWNHHRNHRRKAQKSPSTTTFYRLFMNIIPQGAIPSYISLLFDMKQRYVSDYCTDDR